MSINLVIMPGKVMTWKEFRKKFPGNSIALDGFVNEGPKFVPDGPYANFNHHERVSRLETRATCAQILLAIRQGFSSSFSLDNELTVCVNDCDQDVCLSIFLLNSYHVVVNAMNPLLNQLVAMEDYLDTTAGAYAFPRNLPSLAKVLWVFEPYTVFRNSGGLERKNIAEYAMIISAVEGRIQKFITGMAQAIEMDTRYDVLYDGGSWKMVREVGEHARVGMFADGIKAFVSVRDVADGIWKYVICRISQFINFPVPTFFNKLNLADGIAPSDMDRWSGGDTVGGSPREKHSKSSPDTVVKIISGTMEERS